MSGEPEGQEDSFEDGNGSSKFRGLIRSVSFSRGGDAMEKLLIGFCGLLGIVAVGFFEKVTGRSTRMGVLGYIFVGTLTLCGGIWLASVTGLLSPPKPVVDTEMQALEDIANGR
jgi:hypothetical protein